jgi:phosphate transport system substrate-binding protein
LPRTEIKITLNHTTKYLCKSSFVDFYIQKAPTLVSSVGYVPLPAEGYHLDNVYFNRGKVGTVFEGKAQIGLTIGELLRKEAKF